MVGDLLGAVAVVALCVLLGLLGQPDWLWSAALGCTLALRRSSPGAFAALAGAVWGAHSAVVGGLLLPGGLVLLVAVHGLAARGPAVARRAGAAVGTAGALAVLAAARTGTSWSEKLLFGGLVVAAALAAWSAGLVRRQRATALRHAQERAAFLERDTARAAQIAVHDERVRISREMHDVIAHSLASVVTQAEGGRMAARHSPELAGPLFDQIAATGRQALGDVKTLLHAVDDGAGDTRPAPTLRDLPDLVERARASGLVLAHHTTGTARDVPQALGLAVYRVVQESITNVLRHAPGSAAVLTVEWEPTVLRVATSNTVTGPSARPSGTGRGLVGIEQRCAVFGAALSIETGDGAFTVTSSWPLTASGPPA